MESSFLLFCVCSVLPPEELLSGFVVIMRFPSGSAVTTLDVLSESAVVSAVFDFDFALSESVFPVSGCFVSAVSFSDFVFSESTLLLSGCFSSFFSLPATVDSVFDFTLSSAVCLLEDGRKSKRSITANNTIAVTRVIVIIFLFSFDRFFMISSCCVRNSND